MIRSTFRPAILPASLVAWRWLSHLHVRVAVRSLHDLVGQVFHCLLHFGRIELAADQPLDREDGVVGVRDRLPLRDLTHQPLAALGDRHHRRRGPASLCVRDHRRLAAFHHGHA
jgi:hypothetical protein